MADPKRGVTASDDDMGRMHSLSTERLRKAPFRIARVIV